MPTSDIRKINLSFLEHEPGCGRPRPPELARVLSQFWPECFTSMHGGVVMKPEEKALLEELFVLFGVPLKVAENSIKVLGHAYDVFAIALGPHVSYWLRNPERAARHFNDWPPEWVSYLEAVATRNTSEARRLAILLQPLAPECGYPPRVTVSSMAFKE